jgi:RNA methyltransferase, TrmH family
MLTKNEITYIRLLKDKKHRDAENSYVVEGIRSLKEYLVACPKHIKMIYAAPEGQVDASIVSQTIPITRVSDIEMGKISFLKQPTPFLAVVKKSGLPVPSINTGGWNLCLDGIQDPGNLGSIIRIADWFGLSQIWCSEDCADAYNPKVVQSAMGSLARVNVGYTQLKTLLTGNNLPVYASAMAGKKLYDIHIKYGILVIGNEGNGIREETLNLANYKVTIPRIGQAESLNAAVATGIMLSHLTAPPPQSRGH